MVTGLIGMAGSLPDTWFGQHLLHMVGDGQSAGFIASIVAAIVLLLFYQTGIKNKAS